MLPWLQTAEPAGASAILHIVTLLFVSLRPPGHLQSVRQPLTPRPIFFPGLDSRLDMTVGDALRKPGFWLRFFQVRRLLAAGTPDPLMLDAFLTAQLR